MPHSQKQTVSQSVNALFRDYVTHRDIRTLAELYTQTAPRLLAAAARKQVDRESAEDALHATFLVVMEAQQALQADHDVWAWLFTVFRNRLSQGRRQIQFETTDVEPYSDTPPAWEVNECLRTIEMGVAAIPDPFRSVVELKLGEGLGPSEIAARLNRSAVTVRSQLRRGLAFLRDWLPPGLGAVIASLVLESEVSAATPLASSPGGEKAPPAKSSESHRWLDLEPSRSSLKFGIGALVVALASSMLAIMFAFGEDANPRTEGETLTASDHAFDPSKASLATATAAIAPSREDVVDLGAGSLTVQLSDDNGFLSGARVVITLQDKGTQFLLREISDRWGARQVIVPLAQPDGHRALHATTPADGTCRFEGIPAGTYLIEMPGCSELVAVKPGGASLLERNLGSITRVIRGTVRDEFGNAVVDAEILSSRGRDEPVAEYASHTDSLGGFVITAAYGSFIVVRAGGYQSQFWTFGKNTPDRSVDFRLDRGGAQLTGVVTDGLGRALGGAEVQIGDGLDAREKLSRGISTVPTRVRTDQQGRFQFEGVAPGTVTVHIEAKNFASAAVSVELSNEPASMEIVLLRGGSVEGTITSPAGEPIQGASVHGLSVNGKTSALTDSSGKYVLHDLSLGALRLVASREGEGSETGFLTVAAGETQSWNASLDPSSTRLHGRLLGTPQQLADALIVSHTVLPPYKSRLTSPGKNGRFEFELHVEEIGGPLSIAVFSKKAYRKGEASVALPLVVYRERHAKGKSVDIDLSQVQGLGSIALQLNREFCAASRQFQLRRTQPKGVELIAHKMERCPHTLEVESLPPGEYWIQIDGQRSGPYAVQAGERLELGMVNLASSEVRCTYQERLVIFTPPAGELAVGHLFVEALDPAGRLLDSFILGPDHDTWHKIIAVPTSTSLIRASQVGLVAEGAWQSHSASSESYPLRIQLDRVPSPVTKHTTVAHKR